MTKFADEPQVDDALVRLARAGDCGALVRLASRWWPIVGRVAWAMLGNAAQAAAVTEEVLTAVLDSAQEPETPIGCSMIRLAIWLAIVRRRSIGCRAQPRTPFQEALGRLCGLDRAALLLRDGEEMLSLAKIRSVRVQRVTRSSHSWRAK